MFSSLRIKSGLTRHFPMHHVPACLNDEHCQFSRELESLYALETFSQNKTQINHVCGLLFKKTACKAHLAEGVQLIDLGDGGTDKAPYSPKNINFSQ